jgi:acetyltransferase-like isoleucine patch superfamily enzyme
MGRFFWRLRKKVFKRWARNAFFPGWRLRLLRWCGYDIGQGVYIADDLLIAEELEDHDNLILGDRVSIAPRVTIVLSSHPNNSRIRPVAPVKRAPVVIEADVWLGTGVVVLPGVRIGRGAIVGANSVVTHDVAPLHVVAGQPARTIRVLQPPPGWS